MRMVVPVRSGNPEQRHLLRILRPTLVARAASALLSNPAAKQRCSAETRGCNRFAHRIRVRSANEMPPPPIWFAGLRISRGKYGVGECKISMLRVPPWRSAHSEPERETTRYGKEFAEKLGFRCAAPKGASDFEELMPSLKRCPDTKRSLSRECEPFRRTCVFP